MRGREEERRRGGEKRKLNIYIVLLPPWTSNETLPYENYKQIQ